MHAMKDMPACRRLEPKTARGTGVIKAIDPKTGTFALCQSASDRNPLFHAESQRDGMVEDLRRDYTAMSMMIFGTVPTFDEVMASVARLESAVRLLRYTLHVNLGLGRAQSQINVVIGTEICRPFVSFVLRSHGPYGPGPPPRVARPPPTPETSHHQSDLSEAAQSQINVPASPSVPNQRLQFHINESTNSLIILLYPEGN
jgi:hypothetical protein